MTSGDWALKWGTLREADEDGRETVRAVPLGLDLPAVLAAAPAAGLDPATVLALAPALERGIREAEVPTPWA